MTTTQDSTSTQKTTATDTTHGCICVITVEHIGRRGCTVVGMHVSMSRLVYNSKVVLTRWLSLKCPASLEPVLPSSTNFIAILVQYRDDYKQECTI